MSVDFSDLTDLVPSADSTDTPAESSNGSSNEWPKTLTDVPAGEIPDGCVTVQDFAARISAKLAEQKVAEGMDLFEAVAASQVLPQNFYNAIKRDKDPMPSVKVPTEGGEDRVYIPIDEATEWYLNRPARGGSGAPRSEEEVTSRLRRAGSAKQKLDEMEARYEKFTARLDKQRSLVNRYGELLAEDGKTWEEATRVFEESAEAKEAANAIEDNN